MRRRHLLVGIDIKPMSQYPHNGRACSATPEEQKMRRTAPPGVPRRRGPTIGTTMLLFLALFGTGAGCSKQPRPSKPATASVPPPTEADTTGNQEALQACHAGDAPACATWNGPLTRFLAHCTGNTSPTTEDVRPWLCAMQGVVDHPEDVFAELTEAIRDLPPGERKGLVGFGTFSRTASGDLSFKPAKLLREMLATRALSPAVLLREIPPTALLGVTVWSQGQDGVRWPGIGHFSTPVKPDPYGVDASMGWVVYTVEFVPE